MLTRKSIQTRLSRATRIGQYEVTRLSDVIKERLSRNLFVEPGHFYSPITTSTDFQHFGDRKRIPGIELNEDDQLSLLKKLGRYYQEQPFTAQEADDRRYYFDNDSFSYSDALFLYSMLRELQPRRVIEVGSGFSSALMLDVNDIFLGNSMDLTFIEPYPMLLNSLLRENDGARLVQQFVQEVTMAEFEALEAGDVLFIDSSHVSKAGSDVNWLYFEILPVLKPGVFIHVHDIFHPFEYPDRWIKKGRSWNEAYLLRGILSGSGDYSIQIWPQFLHQFHTNSIQTLMPLTEKNPGGSIWLRKE